MTVATIPLLVQVQAVVTPYPCWLLGKRCQEYEYSASRYESVPPRTGTAAYQIQHPRPLYRSLCGTLSALLQACLWACSRPPPGLLQRHSARPPVHPVPPPISPGCLPRSFPCPPPRPPIPISIFNRQRLNPSSPPASVLPSFPSLFLSSKRLVRFWLPSLSQELVAGRDRPLLFSYSHPSWPLFPRAFCLDLLRFCFSTGALQLAPAAAFAVLATLLSPSFPAPPHGGSLPKDHTRTGSCSQEALVWLTSDRSILSHT